MELPGLENFKCLAKVRSFSFCHITTTNLIWFNWKLDHCGHKTIQGSLYFQLQIILWKVWCKYLHLTSESVLQRTTFGYKFFGECASLSYLHIYAVKFAFSLQISTTSIKLDGEQLWTGISHFCYRFSVGPSSGIRLEHLKVQLNPLPHSYGTFPKAVLTTKYMTMQSTILAK